MSGHTPGPWRWEFDRRERWVDAYGKDREDGPVGRLVGYDAIVADFGDDSAYEERAGTVPTSSDREVIAAAPTMLSAIEQFEAWWQEVGQVSFNGAPACVFALREAAAKARGGA